MQIVPEYTCGKVSHSVEVVVCYHLRLATGSAGEVHYHRIFVVVDEGWSLEFGRLYYFRLVIAETIGDGLAVVGDGDIMLNSGTLGHG